MRISVVFFLFLLMIDIVPIRFFFYYFVSGYRSIYFNARRSTRGQIILVD